jgi:ABC-type nitrate/sulfonate/bicarbonate transport system substrate-binding protein
VIILRRPSLVVTSLLALLVACSGPAAQAPSQAGGSTAPLPVKFGWQLQTDWSFFAARDGGIFQETGLAPEYVQFPSGREMLAALQSKSIDVASASGVVFDVALAQGLDVKAIWVNAENSRNEGLVARPDSGIQTLADLVGKRVAYTKGSAAHYAVSKALAHANLSAERVTLLDLAPDKAFPAFTGGDVDAWWVWQPWFAKAAAEGGEVITTDKEQGGVTFGVWYARSEWIAHNPEAAKGVARTAALAAERLKQDKFLAVRPVARALAIPEEIAGRVFDQDYLPSPQDLLEQTYLLSMTSPEGLAKALGEIGDFLYEQKIVTNRPDPGKAIDTGPLQAALQVKR